MAFPDSATVTLALDGGSLSTTDASVYAAFTAGQTSSVDISYLLTESGGGGGGGGGGGSSSASGSVSGTVSGFRLTTRSLIDLAFMRAKIPAQAITAEKIQFAYEALWLLLSELPNRSIQLWAVDTVVLPLYAYTPAVYAPTGTIKVTQANLRTLSRQTGTDTVTTTESATEFASATSVTSVGIRWSGMPQTVAVESSSDGATWSAITTYVPFVTEGAWSWIDTTSFAPALHWRVRTTTGNLYASEVFWGNAPSEIPMSPLNRGGYDSLPNKAFTGRPLQYWQDYTSDVPVLRLWPAPAQEFAYAQVVIRRKRYLMDIGTMQQVVELPRRWYEALVWLFAEKIAAHTPEVDIGTAQWVSAQAASAVMLAQSNDRDGNTSRIRYNFSAYTR